MKPKKRFGQHFLRDETVLDRIVQVIDPTPQENIIEVGCGTGILTNELLAKGANVLGLEFDRDLIPVLQKKFSDRPNFSLLQQDVLDFIPQTETSYTLVGNIPYNLTTKLFEKILLWPHKPRRIVFLIQKEVAQKAVKQGKHNSPLAVCVDMLGHASIAFDVPPFVFDPPPKVDSSVLVIEAPGKRTDDPWKLYDFVHKVFRMPRKTLLNNLSAMWGKDRAGEILQKANLDQTRRPESLSFEELDTLFKKYCRSDNWNESIEKMNGILKKIDTKNLPSAREQLENL